MKSWVGHIQVESFRLKAFIAVYTHAQLQGGQSSVWDHFNAEKLSGWESACNTVKKACLHGMICADASNKAQFQHLNVTLGQIIHETNSKASKTLETCLSKGCWILDRVNKPCVETGRVVMISNETNTDVHMYTWRIYSSRYLDTLLYK